MKTTLQTPNGNLIYKDESGIFIVLQKTGQSMPFNNYHGISDFNELAKILPSKEAEIEDLKVEVKYNVLLNKCNKLEQEVAELRPFKTFYHAVPEWYLKGFKNEDKYNAFMKKARMRVFYENAKKQFKLKTNKAVDEQVCFAFTTKYTGKNNGFKHFNRTLKKELCRIDNFSIFNRYKNFCAKKINGEVIECRGNIEAKECSSLI